MDQAKKCIRFVLAFVINSSQTQKCNYAILFLEQMLYTTRQMIMAPILFAFTPLKSLIKCQFQKRIKILNICIKTIHNTGVTLSTVNLEIENSVLMEMHRMITLLLEAI